MKTHRHKKKREKEKYIKNYLECCNQCFQRALSFISANVLQFTVHLRSGNSNDVPKKTFTNQNVVHT